MGRRQNSPIWSFLAVFVGYSTQFFDPGTISTPFARVHENWDVVKTRRFAHFWPFSWAITHSFWLRRRFQWLVIPCTRKLARRKNTSIWSFLTVIMGNSRRFFGTGYDFNAFRPRVHENWDMVRTRRFGNFWSFSWAIAHGFFWLRRLFQRLVTPCTRKLGRRQNSSIWSFLADFVGYSTRFFGSGDHFNGS